MHLCTKKLLVLAELLTNSFLNFYIMLTFFILTAILSVSILSIIASQRFAIEESVRHKYGVDRDWWVPLVALTFILIFGLIDPKFASTVIIESIDIIVLIFTFGVLAEGLAESNVFELVSHQALHYCNNDTKTLILALFTTTSLLTLVTTNDIVILVMTPILIDIAYRSDLRNMKLLLLSQFIAANTLSMGLLIGSPTNIIISETLNIGFIEYAIYMLPIAILAFIFTTAVISAVFDLSSNTQWFNEYALKQSYTKPDVKVPPVTKEMKIWILIFTGFVILTTIVTELNYSLLWCSIPTIIASFSYWRYSSSHPTVSKPLKALPYGVFFFGLTFFIIVGAIGNSQFVTTTLYPTLTSNIQTPLNAILTGIFGSGILVNTFNDLPAAVFIADFLETAPITKEPLNYVFTQAILVGVNIGVYITQVGALAGIIWFNQMRVYKQRYDLTGDTAPRFPNRIDLIKFGLLNFLIVGSLLTLTLYIEYLILA
jgi:arsenical pump membrane protein